jgi:hypothetical protein
MIILLCIYIAVEIGGISASFTAAHALILPRFRLPNELNIGFTALGYPIT